ncbi:MAG: CDP-glycerol glycerophosphotransferase family protein [Nocardioides sp.]
MLGRQEGRHRPADVFHFLGNITSHGAHALPVWQHAGGEFVVLSRRARSALAAHAVPVRMLDDLPRRWRRTGPRLERTDQYLHVPGAARRTIRFLEERARVVLFYELFDFGRRRRLHGPKTVFLSHGNSVKPYFSGRDRVELLHRHDYVAAPGPHGRRVLEGLGVPSGRLVDLGVARTDQVVARRGPRRLSPELEARLGDVSGATVVTYVPTYWGPSSVDGLGLELVRQVRPDQVLLVRLHPQTPAPIVRAYAELAVHRPHVHLALTDTPGRSLLDLLAAADVVVGDLSSVMLEAILLRRPLVFAVCDESLGLLTGDHPFSAVVAESTLLRHGVTDLDRALDEAIVRGIDARVWEETAAQLFFHADGTCGQRMVEFVDSL